MKYYVLCVAVLLCSSAARAASAPGKTVIVDFNLASSGPANGEFVGTLMLRGSNLTGTIVDQAYGYSYVVNPGSTLKAKQLRLTCTLTTPVQDVITLSGTLGPLSGKGKGSFTESFFGETGTYVAMKAP